MLDQHDYSQFIKVSSIYSNIYIYMNEYNVCDLYWILFINEFIHFASDVGRAKRRHYSSSLF